MSTTPATPVAAPGSAPRRVLSVDALRGFDMFWIMGLAGTLEAASRAWPGCLPHGFIEQLDHVEWHGFRGFDLVFPLFLFLAGLSTAFSVVRRREQGEPLGRLHRSLAGRALALVALGLVYNGVLANGFTDLRCASVLARIGLAWYGAAVLALHLRRGGLCAALAGLLLGYWALLAWVPAPGFSAGDFSPEGSLPSWFDRQFLPGVLYGKVFDPEGILGIIPSIGTALLGVLTGLYLREGQATGAKAWVLAGAGVAALTLGWTWGLVFPVNKALWTSSFVLVAGGWSFLLLAAFYWLVDVRGWVGWTYPFRVVGANSIAVYVGGAVLPFYESVNRWFGWWLGGIQRAEARAFVLHLLVFALVWVFAWFLYRQRWFLRV
ncbi:acyltransferase family protein [Nibricoccus sp. IMCC34717]|uniref:acyltransferase family protein n=1 Tax=Nibricoccus sp. IMCC34717 TaxID=3034021 RepID=UPI00384B4F5B